ncbi:hypothetical protein DSL72_005235 [Monilinia vaccinii-corymbosi]|uniref:Uncharacterized protein n=1 Tax=Monilinia vaccinii-corymbosi TaxID=61207 RepID=A0A8A3PEM5_9HELO|nr:hypothetical protein DSL72_005235 [Monilinia vaccinii-corymbosi]
MPSHSFNAKFTLTLRSSRAKVFQNRSYQKLDDTTKGLRKGKKPETDRDLTPKMAYRTTPQYSYTNIECRLWIKAQLQVYYFFLPQSTITAIANRFLGSGARMFAMERESWVEMLGFHGNFIRSLIRRILWSEKRSLRAGLSKALMNELKGEYKVEGESEDELEWCGLYPIR